MVGAKFSVNGKPIGDGVSGKADELRSARFDIAAHARCTKRHPAKIVVAELRGKVAVDLVAAKNPERGSFGVATIKTGAIDMASFGLSNRSAQVPAGVAACLRHAHGRQRQYDSAQHCCCKNRASSHTPSLWTKATRRKLGRSVSTLTPAFCPRKKGRQSRPFLGANCLSVE